MSGQIVNKHNISINYFLETPVYNKGKGVIQDRVNHLKHALTFVKNTGLFLEFGIYNGSTINLISSINQDDTIWGFDSFEGLPEDWATTDNEIVWHKGFFAVDKLPKVNSNVRLVKGWFDTTLPNWINEYDGDISFLHIDCDLYSSTSTVLTLLNNRINPGTIIVFDELYHFGNPKKYTRWQDGEYKALTEWVGKYDRKFKVVSRNNHMQTAIQIIK
jgi:hypothetical protein